MMLLDKAWRESRARAVTGALVLSFLCVMVSRADLSRLPLERRPTFAQYVWRNVYDGNVQLVFALVATLLGLGGLMSERSAGSAQFTLALPVGRSRLHAARAAVGLAQTTVLACIPLLIVPVVSGRYQPDPYPFEQAIYFTPFLVIGGCAWFAIGFLWSCAFLNEHTTAAACLATPFAAMAAANAPGLHQFPRLHLLNIMSGRDLPYLDPDARIFIGPFPWATLMAVALLGAALLTAGAALVQRRDF